MKINPKYRALEQATDCSYMSELFTKLLRQIAPGSEHLINLKIPRLFPYRNNSFVIQYDLTIKSSGTKAEKIIIVGGELTFAGASPKTKVNPGQNIIQCDDLPLLLMVFPNDPSLPALQELILENKLPVAVESAITEQLSSDFSLSDSKITPLGWRPGRRAVVKIEAASDSASDSGLGTKAIIVKLVRQKKAKKLFERIDNLSQLLKTSKTLPYFVIPEIISASSESGVIVLSAIEGQNLFQLLNDDRFRPGCYQAGRLLLSLHHLNGQSLPSHSWAQELEITRRIVGRTIELFEEADMYFSDHLEKMYNVSGMQLLESEQMTIHRDFYDKQIIPGESLPALLDLDNLSLGDPAQDVGNFLAHCDLRTQQYPRQDSLNSDGEMAFLSGYGIVTDKFWARVTQWKKLTLLRLTCLYLLRPGWRDMAPGLLRAQQPEKRTDLQPRGNI